MKKSILLFFTLSALFTTGIMAQGGRPPLRTIDTVLYFDKNSIIQQEGDIAGFGDNAHVGSHASTTSGSVVYTYNFFTKPGMLTHFDRITVSIQGAPVMIKFSYNRVAFQPAQLERISSGPGSYSIVGGSVDPNGASQTVVLAENLDIYENGNIQIQATALTTTDPNISVGGYALEVTSQQNWGAPNTWLAIGDSREYSAGGLVGGTGSIGNPGIYNIHQKLCDQLTKEGVNTRLVSKGVSGATASGYMYRVINNELKKQIQKATFISLELGVNDANVGTAASQGYDTKMQMMIDTIFALNPKVTLFLENIYGSSIPTIATNYPAYNTILASYPGMGKYAGRHVYLVNWNSAIPNPTASNDPNFTETAFGTQLHARWDTGHAALYSIEMPIVRTSYGYTHHN